MALFPNTSENNKGMYDGLVGKTHTNLVVSDGNAPAERVVVSKENKAKPFIYEYGPEGNQTVLLAKGKILEAVGTEFDKERGHAYTSVRQAEEDSATVLGVNHHNVYEQRRDRMEGNQPTIITRNFIEVPFFEADDAEVAAATAEAMRFGAGYGQKDKIKPGAYVVTGKAGNFKLYEKGTHDISQIVGQVWAVNKELAPEGFLKYYTQLENTELEEYLKQISAPPAGGKGDYPYGAPYSNKSWKPKFEKDKFGLGTQDTGIPFLTDGFFSSLKRLSITLDQTENVEAAVANEVGKVATKNFESSATPQESAMLFVKLKHKINPRAIDNVKVTYTKDGSKTMSTKDVHIDLVNNTVVLYFDEKGTYEDVTIDIECQVNPTAGVPTEWDYQGSVGALRILLQK